MASSNNNNNNNSSDEIENKILQTVHENSQIEDTGLFASQCGWSHDDTFVGAIKRLEALSIFLENYKEISCENSVK